MTKLVEDTCQYRVYVEDTDLMGIVYHANYLRFFERARTELLRKNGFNLTTMATHGTNFAIHNVHMRYVYPARLDDVLSISTTCERKKNCSLLFKQEMHNQLGQLLNEAEIQVVCVDKQLKPMALPVGLCTNHPSRGSDRWNVDQICEEI